MAQVPPLVPILVGEKDGRADVLLPDMIAFEEVLLANRARFTDAEGIVFNGVGYRSPKAVSAISRVEDTLRALRRAYFRMRTRP
jgi:hypothetical protein